MLPLAISLVVILPALVPAARALRALELGDDSAHGLGVRVEGSRLALIGLAVGLVSITTVAVGPIGFVALTPRRSPGGCRTAGLAAGVLGADRSGLIAGLGHPRPAPDPRRRCRSAS